MRVGLSEKITNHTLKNILLYPLVWQDVLIFVVIKYFPFEYQQIE